MRVLLATDRPSLGAALSLYLQERDLDVVGVVADAGEISRRAAEARADVVLIDRHLGEAVTAEAVAALARSATGPPAIVLGPSGDAAAARATGAAAVATVGDAPDALLDVLRDVAARRT